jgi:hypothetical protein
MGWVRTDDFIFDAEIPAQCEAGMLNGKETVGPMLEEAAPRAGGADVSAKPIRGFQE